MVKLKIGDREIGGFENLFFVAGPCVIESEEHTLKIAEKLKEIFSELGQFFIFKASFDKANRSSITSYRGPGLEEGLKILRKVKENFNLPILTDFHLPSQIFDVAEVADIVQVPAFLSRQTDMLIAAGKSGRIVNIKKGQFLSPWDIKNVIEKVKSTGNEKIIITERGFSFGYNNLVVDFRSFPVIKSFGVPVIFDVTHSLQLPGGLGNRSGGMSQFIEPLAKAGVACGVDGVFFEVHDNPACALCDGPNALEIGKVKSLVKKLISVNRISNLE